MPFSNRAFCRALESPSLSELLIWLRQQGTPATQISQARPSGDLLSSFWERADLQIAGEPALALECIRADAAGVDRLTAAVGDFVADVQELPDTPARARVLEHLAAVRSLVVVEFSTHHVSDQAEEVAGAVLALFVERAGGLAQRDGVGFLDEDDDVVLALG
jgi:hypothetical protein